MHLFYDPTIQKENSSHTLSEEESKHACKVLRMSTGDALVVLDGNGTEYRCSISEATPKKCKLSIESFETEPKDAKEIHLAIAPTKNIDRIEWLLEKATEIGITEITFLRCSNSERKVIKEDRLQRILVSAMKQSKRLYLPKLNGFIPFSDFINNYPKGLIAHCYTEDKEEFKDIYQEQDCPILIGPEGDFTKEEVEKAINSGYKTLTLGKNRLRTETAGLMVTVQAKLF